MIAVLVVWEMILPTHNIVFYRVLISPEFSNLYLIKEYMIMGWVKSYVIPNSMLFILDWVDIKVDINGYKEENMFVMLNQVTKKQSQCGCRLN